MATKDLKQPLTSKSKKKWWKKGQNIIIKTNNSTNNMNTNNDTNNKTSKLFNRNKKATKNSNKIRSWASTANLPQIKNPSTLSEAEINQIQTDLLRVTQQRNQLEHELNTRAQQLEQMEENLRGVSDQLKIIGRMAMEKEQLLSEVNEALTLKTKQLEMYRRGGNNAQLNKQTMLPMHLRGKFSEFLRGVLLQQKQFFDKALNHFVNKSISDDEIKYGNTNKNVEPNKIRVSLIQEISKIGLNIMKDYVMELELRLNGIFHQQNNPNSNKNINNNNSNNNQQMMKQQMNNTQQMQQQTNANNQDLIRMQQQMMAMENVMNQNKINPTRNKSSNNSDDDNSVIIKDDTNDDDNKSEDLTDDDDDDDDGTKTELRSMMKHMRTLTQKHLDTFKHGTNKSAEMNKIFSQMAAFKKQIERPSNAPTPFRVADKTQPFIELRDMLEALPYDITKAILTEQEISKNDRIRDVLFQRGCWPMVRFSSNKCKILSKNVPFNDILLKIETYLTSQDINSKRNRIKREPGMYLLGTLDPQHTTGYRLHQISAIIRQRNESRHMITALTIRVGRLWQENDNNDDFNEDNEYDMDNDDDMDDDDDNLVSESLDFFQSLPQPSLMLLLGANSAEKSALCRELSRQISTKYNKRTALVDTRSGVAGYLESPLETGQSVRFYVNSITNQSNIIDQTRSIFPQCVIVDEVLSENDINVVSKLQSEGISCIVGTNMHSLKALIGHPVFSRLLPQQQSLNHNNSIKNINTISPYLIVLEMDYKGNNVKMYKNIPDAIVSIKKKLEPPCKNYNIKWNDAYIQNKHSQTNSAFITHKIMNSYSSNIPTNNIMFNNILPTQ